MPSATESAAATRSEVTGLFDQAFRSFGDSVKVAMKAQEETVKFWSDVAGKVSPMQTVVGEVIPTAQKSADEYLRLMESGYRRNADLLKMAIKTQENGDRASVEKRTRDWWEASMEVARDNVQELAAANLRIAESWTQVFKKAERKASSAGK